MLTANLGQLSLNCSLEVKAQTSKWHLSYYITHGKKTHFPKVLSDSNPEESDKQKQS